MFFLLSQLVFADPDPQKELDKAKKELQNRNYDMSSELLNHLMRDHNGQPQATEAKIIMADLFFQKGEYPTARVYYQHFLQDHPSHPQASRALYRIGQTQNKDAPKSSGRDQRATHAAIKTWEMFLYKYPNSPYRAEVEAEIIKSKDRLAHKELEVAQFYARRQQWEAVRRRSTYMLQKYPSSKHLTEGLILNALSLYLLGKTEEAQKMMTLLKQKSPEAITTLERRIQKEK